MSFFVDPQAKLRKTGLRIEPIKLGETILKKTRNFEEDRLNAALDGLSADFLEKENEQNESSEDIDRKKEILHHETALLKNQINKLSSQQTSATSVNTPGRISTIENHQFYCKKLHELVRDRMEELEQEMLISQKKSSSPSSSDEGPWNAVDISFTKSTTRVETGKKEHQECRSQTSSCEKTSSVIITQEVDNGWIMKEIVEKMEAVQTESKTAVRLDVVGSEYQLTQASGSAAYSANHSTEFVVQTKNSPYKNMNHDSAESKNEAELEPDNVSDSEKFVRSSNSKIQGIFLEDGYITQQQRMQELISVTAELCSLVLDMSRAVTVVCRTLTAVNLPKIDMGLSNPVSNVPQADIDPEDHTSSHITSKDISAVRDKLEKVGCCCKLSDHGAAIAIKDEIAVKEAKIVTASAGDCIGTDSGAQDVVVDDFDLFNPFAPDISTKDAIENQGSDVVAMEVIEDQKPCSSPISTTQAEAPSRLDQAVQAGESLDRDMASESVGFHGSVVSNLTAEGSQTTRGISGQEDATAAATPRMESNTSERQKEAQGQVFVFYCPGTRLV